MISEWGTAPSLQCLLANTGLMAKKKFKEELQEECTLIRVLVLSVCTNDLKTARMVLHFLAQHNMAATHQGKGMLGVGSRTQSGRGKLWNIVTMVTSHG